MKWLGKMGRKFTADEDDFLRKNIDKCYTLYDLTDSFCEQFPEHPTTYGNIQKRLKFLGIKKGTHNIRKEKVKSVNAIGTVICDKRSKKARVKTENGYVHANTYFIEKYFGEQGKGKMIVHLNGNYADFSKENVALVSKAIYASLHWRKWIFTDAELTKTAILAAELLEMFPDLRHNENQFYKLKRGG